ncbi:MULTISPECIES: CPBP family intramembrane glutamic endopeptidase [unclassified Maribacter]|uniref:CPBP family intramembrane glutamic endopeptidase n=1 Tax=unclassified Maribacter TaxID=2615042 RepID=UPI00257F5BF9|nr:MULTISPECIES: CPBP family intramembrane glutamic endopeptidase [unclassified Maribacter]|tara:strand:+ start:340610 stop:341479 length:870 start_codon:yes stop_codon:yes gene_type:complete
MIKETLLDLYHFIKNPTDTRFELSFKEKTSFIFILLIFELIITFVLIAPIEWGMNLLIDVRTDRINYHETIWVMVFGYIMLMPLIEELIFRYFLRYKGFKTRFISIKKWKSIFHILVYLSALMFGLVHLTNYTNNENVFYILAPFTIISQILGGLIISFIRVRLSFIYGVFYHSLWNFIVLLALPGLILVIQNPIKLNSNKYSLSVHEKLFFDEKFNQEIKIDSANGKIFEMNIKQYSLQHILDTLYKPKTFYVDDVLIDAKFKSKYGVDKSKIVDIFGENYDIKYNYY